MKNKLVKLPDYAQAMLNPAIYPDNTAHVELIQTQMSFVFLTDSYVYKTKKPVNLGYLDYTTLEKRRFFCEQELALNRRLCPEAYIAVVAIAKKDGLFNLENDGEVIEYAVKMHRLPLARMMNVLLGQDGVNNEMLKALAQKIADFHQRAETGDAISAFGKLEAIKTNTDENFNQTQKYVGRVFTQSQFKRIKTFTNETLIEKAGIFSQRVKNGGIRDCHGDLHAAHICFTNGICIYDCIEFNDRFRFCDVASEIAFLSMDLDHYGHAGLSRNFCDSYIQASRDKDIINLLDFYKCYRAYVRAKVACFKIDDPYTSEAGQNEALEIARSYFDLAEFYTRKRPALFITVGLVGTGKTTLAQALAKRLGLVMISSDVTRKNLAAVPLTEHRFEGIESGIYSPDFTRKTYDKMFADAKTVLADGGSVILDASFIKAGERLKAKNLAEETGADFIVLECVLEEDIIKQRLSERMKQLTPSDGRLEILGPQKQRFEPVKEVSPRHHIVIDASKPITEQTKKVAENIPW